MLQPLAVFFKWVSIPALLAASLFTGLAAGYEPLVNIVVCMGALVCLQRAVWLHQYVSGAGLIAIVIMFIPVFLAAKIFLLLGLTCFATVAALLSVLRMRRTPVSV